MKDMKKMLDKQDAGEAEAMPSHLQAKSDMLKELKKIAEQMMMEDMGDLSSEDKPKAMLAMMKVSKSPEEGSPEEESAESPEEEAHEDPEHLDEQIKMLQEKKAKLLSKKL